jgi:hypothetical protein
MTRDPDTRRRLWQQSHDLGSDNVQLRAKVAEEAERIAEGELKAARMYEQLAATSQTDADRQRRLQRAHAARAFAEREAMAAQELRRGCKPESPPPR